MFLFYNKFWFLDPGEVIADGKNCASMTNAACSTCAKYRYGKATLNDEEAKCVWVPEFNGCRTKALAKRKGKDYIEDCPGSFEGWKADIFNFSPIFLQFNYIYAICLLYIVEEKSEDVCLKYNGILHESKGLCCNKNCPKCGGKGCATFTNKSGQILGKNQCCSKRIEKRGKTCGPDGSKAPCKLPSNNSAK